MRVYFFSDTASLSFHLKAIARKNSFKYVFFLSFSIDRNERYLLILFLCITSKRVGIIQFCPGGRCIYFGTSFI